MTNRNADYQPATLGTLSRPPGWFWAYCANPNCQHATAVAITPFVIRWGLDASPDLLRKSLRCGKCGHRGATLQHPSWIDGTVGWQPFPV